MQSVQFLAKSDSSKVAFYEKLLHKYCGVVFVYSVVKSCFVFRSSSIESFFQITDFNYDDFSLGSFKQFLHPADSEKLKLLLYQIGNAKNEDSLVADVQFSNAAGEYSFYTLTLSVFSKNPESGAVTEVLGVIQKAVGKKNQEVQRSKEKTKAEELSFFASQELGHEYAKIQSIIQLIDNKYITDVERTDLINEAKKSIQIINSSIFKLNHKLSFNQTDNFFEPEKPVKSYNKILLIDDDVLTNVLNKKIINTVVPDKPLHIFLNIDDALQYLKEKDTEGDYMIFLDINFPDRNGWDFLNEYKNFSTQSKVVVLSSSIDNRDREKSRSYELVIDYITKPLSMEFIKTLFE